MSVYRELAANELGTAIEQIVLRHRLTDLDTVVILLRECMDRAGCTIQEGRLIEHIENSRIAYRERRRT